MNRVLLADLSLVFAVMIWGSTFFLIKEHLIYLDPVGLCFYRFGVAAIAVAMYCRFKGYELFKGFRFSLAAGFWLWVSYASQNIGMLYTTASSAGFISALFVLFVPLFLWILFKVKPTLQKNLAAGLALVGLWIFSGGIHGLNKGDLITLFAAVGIALYVIYSDQALKKGIHPVAACFQIFLVVAVLSLVWVLLTGGSFVVGSVASYGVLVYLTVFATLLCFGINLYVQRISTPTKVGLIFAFEPVFTALFAWGFGSESMTVLQMFGGFLIVLSLFVAEISWPKKRTSLQLAKNEN